MATVSRRSGAWKAWNTCVCLVGQILIGSLSLGTKFGKMYFITHTALPIWLGMHFLASSMPLTTWPSWPHGVAMANMLAIRVCHLSAPALRRGLSKADLSQMRQAPATHLGAPEGAWLNCSLTGRGLMRRLKPLSGLRAAAEPEASLRAEG